MSRERDIGDGGGGAPDLGATEEMATAGGLPLRRSLSSKRVPAAPPSEPVQLTQGQSSGEPQAAYATGPKAIPPSRHSLGSDPAPAVIVDGAQSHSYEPLETPQPPSSSAGLYLPPVGTPPPATKRGGGTVPMAPAFAAPQFAPGFAALPPKRRSRSETVLITVPKRKSGPSSKEKVLAFVVMMIIVVLLGVIFLLWKGLGRTSTATPAVETAVETAPEGKTILPSPPEPVFIAPPPVAVVGAPAVVVDAGAKKLLKKR
jgi:hypothetical protein